MARMNEHQVMVVAQLTKRSNGELTVANIMELFAISRKLSALDTKDCNQGLSDAEERREERLVVRANEIASKAGAKAFHQSDPRGCSLYVCWPEDIKGQDILSVYTNGVAVCD